MTSMTTTTGTVIGGVDTHGETNHAAVLDGLGRQLGDREFPTIPSGYRQLLTWLSSYGPISRVGMEGTSSYGAGLARHLRAASICSTSALSASIIATRPSVIRPRAFPSAPLRPGAAWVRRSNKISAATPPV